MLHTVVGVFTSHIAAQRAAQHLASEGIDPENIHVTDADDDMLESLSDQDAEASRGPRGALSEIFGAGTLDEASGVNYDVAHDGAALVAVQVPDESHLDIVEDLLAEAGAMEIEEKVGRYKQ